MGRLEGKSVIITGAGSGIGRAASLLFTREGAKLIAVDRTEGVKETVEQVRKAGGTAEAVMADAGSEKDVMAFATSSQTCCLREEITTLAPCSAMRSAMARPMPREEPVMTATFPDISNKVMRFSPRLIGSERRPFLFNLELSSVRAVRQQTRLQASLLAVAISGPAG